MKHDRRTVAFKTTQLQQRKLFENIHVVSRNMLMYQEIRFELQKEKHLSFTTKQR